jgi:hypothetical protein
MKTILSVLLTSILSSVAFASPSKNHGDHPHGEVSKTAPHCSETVRKLKTGPQAKQEAEFETLSVPCHNHIEHARIGGQGSTQTAPTSLPERKSRL